MRTPVIEGLVRGHSASGGAAELEAGRLAPEPTSQPPCPTLVSFHGPGLDYRFIYVILRS